MPRPRLELGTWGKITRTEIADNKWRARARFRDFTGRTKQREAYGESGAKAERNLLKSLRNEVESAGDTITGSTTVTALSKIWLADPDLTENCTAQTVERYTDSVNQHVLPALGVYMLMEVTVSRVDRFLRNLAASTPGLAKTARSVLNGMFKLAMRHDAIRSNPVRDVRLPSKPKRPVEALTVDEVSALREGLRGWQEEAGYRGPRRGSDLLDVVDVLLRRRVEAIPTETNAVFPSGKGTWKWPNNYRRSLREALKTIEDGGGISPHVFRKSVATLIDAEATLEAAAAVLGHSGTAVTSTHYVKKATAAPTCRRSTINSGRTETKKMGKRGEPDFLSFSTQLFDVHHGW